MINLIPNEEKKKMRRDFYLRFSTVIFLILGAAAILVAVAISPSVVLLAAKGRIVNNALEKQKNEPLPEINQKVLSIADDLNAKLNIISAAEETKFFVTEKVINELLVNKLADIKITAILYEVDPEGVKKVRIRGSAPSRERLVLFRRALEDSLAWEQIDLPISNFVKGSNIEFTLTLTPS